jgi:hypothetical protein
LFCLALCITFASGVCSPVGISGLLLAPRCDRLWYKNAHILKFLQ